MDSHTNELSARLGLNLDEYIDFRGLVYSFWRHKWSILSIMFVSFAFALIYLLLKAPLYEADALIQIQGKSHDNFGVLTQFNVESIDANPTATQAVLIRSRVIAEPVLKRLGTPANEDAINNLISRISVQELDDTQNNRTNILRIRLRDVNPIRLVKTLNMLILVTQENDATRKSLETAKTLDFLNQRMPLVKADLERAETAYNKYRAESGKLDVTLETAQLMGQIADIEKQINFTQLKEVDLQQDYTSSHPFIIELKNKLNQLEQEKMILEKKIKTLPASDQVAANLLRDVKVKNDLYLILLSKIQENQVIKAGTVSDVRILAWATLPSTPLSKKSSLVIFASIVLGFLLGCLLVMIRKAFLRTISDPRWIEQHLNLNNLAIIPFSKQQAKNMVTFKAKHAIHIDILADKYPRDLSVEALRSLRTSFQIALAGATSNIISIMGVMPSIGKSFISTNFTYLLASVGKRVLLIDGDIRKGHLHDYFKLTKRQGLTDVIEGKITLEQAIQQTTFKNLSFLPCGFYPQNPAELLMRDCFKQIIDTVSQQFDLVLIDTAPILAVTDSAIIGVLSGLNLLVLGSGMHQAEEIMLAVKQMQNAGVKIHGTIFNTLKPEVKVYGNYQYNYHINYQEDARV